ncbi:MAG: hypothetical protein DMG78_16350 [Acidobacteria bacterium]|nr:MAG: hypothetical protein DMG78_16350 [Acidobacteriota bacterium]
MSASAEIYFEHERWGRALAWSAGLHVGITVALLVYTAYVTRGSGDTWGSGGGGEAIGATLVSTVPLPASPTQTQNVLANESKGITQSQPKIEEKEPDAIEIAGKNKKIKQPPKKQITESKSKPQSAPEPEENQVAFGEGGPVSGPYGTFSAAGAKGGFGISGGGGDFGNKYAWYVQVIQRKVSENWLKYEVDPRINVRIEQSSGVPSLDISAARALQRIDTFGPLPPDYPGSKISVEYWFDYKH